MGQDMELVVNVDLHPLCGQFPKGTLGQQVGQRRVNPHPAFLGNGEDLPGAMEIRVRVQAERRPVGVVGETGCETHDVAAIPEPCQMSNQAPVQ